MKRILDMKVTTAAWILIGLMWGGIGLMWSMTTPADAHDTSSSHNTKHAFHYDYHDVIGVYCGWRHGFDGISCVNVNE